MSTVTKILLVEDDVMTAELYQTLLEKAGYRVFHAIDTRRAEEILEAETIDLFLIDYDLPDDVGLHWLRMLRDYEAFALIPAILISYLPRYDDLTTDNRVWFMQKPKLPQQIVTAVESTIALFS